MKKELNLGKDPILKLLFTLALPMVVAQIINVLYNLVDRIYIGNMSGVGANALTGVGVTFPIIILISAFSAFVGAGGAPHAAIKLGEQDKKGASHILGNSFVMLTLVSIVLTVLFMIYKEPILLAFGASPDTLGYANSYLEIYLLGTIFVQYALGLNQYISAQGKAMIAMKTVVIGAVLNIILDPIFIFGLNMGVKGAALATILSQAVSALWVLQFLLSEKSDIRLLPKQIKIDKKIIIAIVTLGVSPFIMQATEALVQVVFNRQLQIYGGDLYVGSMTIILSVMQIIVLPIQGFAMGAQSLVSYNYGAKNTNRVKETFKYLIVICGVIATLACAIVMLFPSVFVRIFNNDVTLLDLTSKGLRIFMAGIWAFGFQIACQQTLLALGQAKISLFLALLRKVVLLVPLAYFLPASFGVNSIYFSEPIADILAAATTVTVFAINFNKILKKRELN